MDNLATTLKQKLQLVDKSIAHQSRVREKGAEHRQLAQDLRPKLDLVITKTKELQAQVIYNAESDNVGLYTSISKE